MTQLFNLKEAEKEAFRLSTSKDGLYDIFWGCYLIVISFSSQFLKMGLERPWNSLLIGGIAMIGLLIMQGVKKAFILPRIGIVKIGPTRRRRLVRARLILFVSAGFTLGLLGLTLTGYLGGRFFENIPVWVSGFRSVGLFGIVVIVLFSFFAHTMEVPRVHLYGWFFALSFSIAVILEEFVGLTYHLPMAIYGLIVIGVGVAILRRFLQDYPRPNDPVSVDF
jgi:hypothetical protein